MIIQENLFDKIKSQRAIKKEKENDKNLTEYKKKRIRYLKYQQLGGNLSFHNFENPEMLEYEKDHKANPKRYPNFRTWKKLKMQERNEKAKIEEKESKNTRRKAQAEHDKSIAAVNKQRAKRMEKENMLNEDITDEDIFLAGYNDAIIDLSEGIIKAAGTGLNTSRKIAPTVAFGAGATASGGLAVKSIHNIKNLSQKINSKEMEGKENAGERKALRKARNHEIGKAVLGAAGTIASGLGAVHSVKKLPNKFE